MFNTQKFQTLNFDVLHKMINRIPAQNDPIDSVESADELYEPDTSKNTCYQCKSSDILFNSQLSFSCNDCGYVTTNTYTCEFANFQAFNIKSSEERARDLKILYMQLENDCHQILSKGGLSESVIEQIKTDSLSQLKKLDTKTKTVLPKFFACILYESIRDISFNKKAIYDHFHLDVNKHCQQLKRMNQMNEQFKEQPQVVQFKLIGNELNASNLYMCLFRYCKVNLKQSSANFKVFSLISGYLDLQDCQLKNTTNSVVIEFAVLQGVKLHHEIWKQLIETDQLPKEIKYIDTFLYKLDLTQTPPKFYKKRDDAKSTMNTAINIHVKSYLSDKLYNLKVFSKGKIVVAGLLTPYEQSEVNVIITKVVKCLLAINKRVYQPPNTIKTILSNFSSQINIDNKMIDIHQAYEFIQTNMDKLQALCTLNNTRCSSIKVINHRIYINLNIYKHIIHFANENKVSTSNSRNYRSVLFILTQRGIYNIQGADDDLINTLHVRSVFNLIVDDFIKKFTYSTQQTFNEEAFIDENELKVILEHCKSGSQEIDQLISTTWRYFQFRHIFAHHSIKIKKQYFFILMQLIKLSISNDKDHHTADHPYSSNLFMIEKYVSLHPESKDIPKLGTLNICYKCLISVRKQVKIAQKSLFTFLQFVSEIPSIAPSVVLLIKSVIFIMYGAKKSNSKISVETLDMVTLK